MTSATRVAFLGLGRMGSAMARNLLGRGFSLTVWNRTAAVCEPLVSDGARTVATPEQAVRDVDFVLYSLGDDAAIERVVFAPDGVVAGVRTGAVVVNLSTVHPATSRRERAAYDAKGAGFLDAPVFGSRAEAEAGGLWIMVGGEREIYDRARPVLAAISASTHYMGGTGQGASTGLIGSLIVALQLQALSEGLILAQKAGLDTQAVLEILALPDFRSPIFSGMGSGMVSRDFSCVFSLEHLHKDTNQIARLADDLVVPVPGLAAARETIKSAVCNGWGEENASAIVKALELQANVRLGETVRGDG